MSDGKIVMILSGFPRRSETFALNEVLALEQRGALAAIFATKAGEPFAMQPVSKALLSRVQVLTEEGADGQATEVVRLLKGTAVAGVHGYFAHAPAEVAEQVAMRLRQTIWFQRSCQGRAQSCSRNSFRPRPQSGMRGGLQS